MNSDISSGLTDAPAGPSETRHSSVGTTREGTAPRVPQSAIERIAALSSDQLLLGRLINLLLFRAQYFILRRVYIPRPPRNSRLLHLGCGDTFYEGWVNADRLRVTYLLLKAGSVVRGRLKLPEWIINAASKWNCPDNYWEGIYTEHVLEHLSYRDVIVALKEAFRTLQPGRWIRILLPDLQRYVEFYNSRVDGTATNSWFSERFAYGAEAIAFLTQNNGHASVWDAELLSAVLAEIGFSDIATVTLSRGTDRRVIMDNPAGRHESLYVEAQKPAA